MRNWDHLLSQSALSVKDYVRNHHGRPARANTELEQVRVSMLQAVSEMGPIACAELTDMHQAILKARDAQALWHLQCTLLGWMAKTRRGYFANANAWP
jgi:hypothetical protein